MSSAKSITNCSVGGNRWSRRRDEPTGPIFGLCDPSLRRGPDRARGALPQALPGDSDAAKFNVLLDVEPIRPGEGEAEAALRLLGRIRRVYGVRFFDAVTVDSWYVQGPFLNAVEKLGWAWVVVLKQERMEVFQEARALSATQKPALEFDDEARDRLVQLWEVNDLDLGESYGRKVRVVHAREQWVHQQVVGAKQTRQPRTSHWWWMASEGLQGYPVRVVYEGGHRRWGIENKAFNELRQFYHLEHCYHHEPVAMLAQMLILLLGFVLFSAYALLHSQQVRLGQLSLKELAHDLDLALARRASDLLPSR